MTEPFPIRQLTWDDFEVAAREIALRFVRRKPRITHVWGPPRGGLCLAVKLSHLLGAYFGPETLASGFYPRDHTLIVDDILDTGHTMKRLDHFPARAVWVTKQPDASIIHVEVAGPEWIIFPWENPKQAQRDRQDFLLRRPAAEPGQ